MTASVGDPDALVCGTTASVVGLALAPVKGTRLTSVTEVNLGRGGVGGDRRFYVIDERNRMLNAKQLGPLTAVVSEIGPHRQLSLRFPDGDVVQAPVRDGEQVITRFYSRPRVDRLVVGPFSAALSRYLGHPVSLVRAITETGALDRGARGGVSVISRASLAELATQAGVDTVDVRRFRMTIEVDGVGAHEEDAWVGRRVRVGAALVGFRGHVGRCLVTSRDPESGTIDLPTLDLLGSYRGHVDSTEPLPFGIYGEVLEPGVVAVGDPVVVAS
jgi:uncharacterized protein YcbX